MLQRPSRRNTAMFTHCCLAAEYLTLRWYLPGRFLAQGTFHLVKSWAVSAVLINMLGQGMVISYPSSLLPALREPDSDIIADLHTASWLSSSTGLACILGFLLSSMLMDVLGRKLTHVICTLPGVIGWLLIYFATDVPQIMVGRILGGTTAGASVSVGAIVIGEFTSPRYRGVFLNLKTASVCMGGTILHIMAHFLSWRNIALVAVTPYIIALCINCTWPESPAWLALKQQYENSEKVFYWLRGKSELSKKEIEDMIRAQMNRFSKPQPNTAHKVKEFLKKFTQRDFFKPLNLIVVSIVLLDACGRHFFPAYAMQIIGQITEQKSQSLYYTLGLDVTITMSAICSSILVRMMNRRTLLFSTGFTAVAILVTVCTYLYLVSLGIISKDKSWIPISLLVLYFIFANLGCTPIPLALLGEVFPLAHRGIGSAMSGVCISVGLAAVLQVTPIMLVTFNVYGTFAIYGTIMALTLVILYFTLPETKDRTLQEIEFYFNNGKYQMDSIHEEDVKLTISTHTD